MKDCLLGFNGERRDGLSKSIHSGNGYRAYHPAQMRFQCPDILSPFREGGINSYAYCLGDPVNRTDPSGHMSNGTLFGLIAGTLGGMALSIFTAGLSWPWVVAIDTAFTVSLTASSLAIDHQSPKNIPTQSWALLIAGAALGSLVGVVGRKYFSHLKDMKTITRRWVRGPMMASESSTVAESIINNGRDFTQFRLIGRVPDYNTHRLAPHLNYTVEDTFNGLRRLNIVVHGQITSPTGIGRMRINSSGMLPSVANQWFQRKFYDFSLYDRIQLVMCYGADGGGRSFAARFASVTGVAVQAYEGPLTIEEAAIDIYICGLDTFGTHTEYLAIEGYMNQLLGRLHTADEAFWLGIRSNKGRTFFPDNGGRFDEIR